MSLSRSLQLTVRKELHHQSITQASEETWTPAIAATSAGPAHLPTDPAPCRQVPPICRQAPPQGWAEWNSELRLQERREFLKK